MLDRKWIGHVFPSRRMDLERGRLSFYARAIGVSDPVYLSVEAAQAAGYPDIPALPAFLFAAELDTGSLDAALSDLGIDIARILHGEQGFTHHRMAFAGETLSVRSVISDIYDKKGGALEFLVKKTDIEDGSGAPVAESLTTLVIRNG